MAQESRRRSQNVAGEFYVDSSCIDCDTCRWMAPLTFSREDGKSAVVHQPATLTERRAALHALLACPTASIGTTAKAPDLAAAQQDFPLPVTFTCTSGTVACPGVYHLGYHDASSFGATSYLIQHPAGNVLIDAPRFASPLIRRIEALGGAKWMLFTHRDDVGPHAKWAKHFGLTRVMHEADAPIPDGPVEMFLEGHEPVQILPGLTAIPGPGHTRGHVAYHYDAKQAGASSCEPVLFTGDHLAYNDMTQQLEAWRDVCWYDWAEQTNSMQRLLDWDFEWILPGHGRRVHMTASNMHQQLQTLIAWMKEP